jgi:hypothetical protein
MAKIHKFSQLYDGAEDRIAWLTEDDDGATTKLWFTQRLCKGLVKALVPMLETAQASDAPPEHKEVVQSWEQAAAMAEFGKVPPVQPREETVVGVVRNINIQPAGDGLIMSFDFGAAAPCTLALRLTETRQMLAVLRRLHAAAGWPGEAFPAWIDGPAPDAGPSREKAN